MRGALVHDPELVEAHRALARRLRAARDEASQRGDVVGSERAAQQLRDHLARLPPAEHTAFDPPPVAARLEPLIGRRALKTALEARLASGARMVTLVGTAGVGKTRLALEVTAERPGAVFCDLTEARSAEGVLGLVAAALSVPLTEDDPAAQLGHALRARESTLLVLDNLEQVAADAAALLTRWLTIAPCLQLLGTSRTRLGLEQEELVRVEPLTLLGAIELFARRGARARAGFRLRDADRTHMGAIVQRLDHLPLAIELAAARLSILSLEAISERLEERFGLLQGRLRDPSRRALRGALRWSWDLLSPPAQSALAQVSVFRGGFELEAAEAVVDLSAHADAPTVLDVLEALVDDHLLLARRDAGGEVLRYDLFESIRLFATARLSPETSLLAVTRHADFFGAMGAPETLDALDRDGIQAQRRLRADLENLIAGAERANGDTAGRCGLAAVAVVRFTGPFTIASKLLDMLTERREVSPRMRRRLLYAEGRFLIDAGEATRAEERLTLALLRSREAGERVEEGDALRSLGELHWRQSRMDSAREHLEAAWAIHQETRGRLREGRALCNLGHVHRQLGDPAAAYEAYEAALAIHREVGDRLMEGSTLGNLGGLHRHQGRTEEARAHYEAALAIHREVGHRRFEASGLGNLGILQQSQGDREEALASYEGALHIHRQLGYRRGEGHILHCLGVLWKQQGVLGLAREYYEAALAIHRQLGDRFMVGASLSDLGGLHRQQGRLTEARAHYEAGLAIHRDIGHRRHEAVVLGNLGSLQRQQGDAQAARALYEEALSIHRALGDRSGEALIQSNLGNLSFADGQLDAARGFYEAALVIHRALGDRLREGAVLSDLANLEVTLGREAESQEALDLGEKILRGLGERLWLSRLLCTRGHLYLKQGRREAAASALTEADALAADMGSGPGSELGGIIAKLRAALDADVG